MARAIVTGSVREKLGFPAEGEHSVIERRNSLGLTYPSLATLMNELSPETRQFQTSLEAGDVSAHVTLMIGSNGEFNCPIKLFDDGTFFGDKYTVTLALSNITPEKTAFGLQKSGELERQETDNVGEAGRSGWLIEHWDLAATSDLKVHLSAKANVPVSEILTIIFTLGGVAIFGYGEASGKGQWHTDGTNARYEVPL